MPDEFEERRAKAAADRDEIIKRLGAAEANLRRVTLGTFGKMKGEDGRDLSEGEIDERLRSAVRRLRAQLENANMLVAHYAAWAGYSPRMREIFLEQEKNRAKAAGLTPGGAPPAPFSEAEQRRQEILRVQEENRKKAAARQR
jgi:hypothetical protein